MIPNALSLQAQRGFCICLVALLSSAAVAQELPQGWRRPTPAEAKGQWREKSPTKFLIVTADFDGDGRKDVAELLINDSGKQCGLFVRLSDGRSDWQSLRQAVIRGELRDFGIRVVRPGKYQTLCGSDPSACATETPKVLHLTASAIEFFSYGRASAFFYWDRKTRKFSSVAIGD